MSPPNGVKPVGTGGNPQPVDPKEERKSYLQTSEFFLDPSNTADPAHLQKKWTEDRDFRVKNYKLIGVLDLFARFMNRDSEVTPQKMKAAIDDWTSSPEFASDPVNKVVLGNMYRVLGSFQDPGNAAQAAKLRESLPPPPAAPAAADKKTDEKAKAPEAKPEREVPTGWRFNAVTTNFHFLDDTFRVLPSGYTLGVIPKEGFGQNQSSNFAISLGSEFSYKDFGFFAEGYYQDAKPLSALNSASPTLGDPTYNAKFGQAGVRFGMVEYSDTMRVGTRGKGWNIGLFGRNRVGIGLGAGWCSEITKPAEGAKCTDPNFQLSVFNDGDFLSGGYGPFEMGIRLLPLTTYLNFDSNGLPETNRLPIEFFASYHINPPYVGKESLTSEDVLAENHLVTDSQVTMSALMLAANGIRFNSLRKTEAAYQSQRIISLGLDRTGSQYSLLNAGTMIGGLLSGWNEGAMGYRLQQQFRYGNNGQRIGLGVLLGTELGINLIGLAATPGLPNESEYLSGQTEGITNLQARAFRLNLPMIATRDGLVLLGGLGAFGDLNKAVKDGGGQAAWWATTHGALALGGLVMVLTSGIGNGNGFFGRSILGNQPPNTDRLEVVGSDYDYPAQDGQFYRLSGGSAFLSYGINGLLEYGIDKIKYDTRKGTEAQKKLDDIEGKNKKDPSKPEVKVNVSTDGRSNFQIGVGGTF
ncbi:MAG: hypothetical protein IT573_12445 [Deltaproteobacteria bacterium]|nr:hypothetical protein [Deltaproteobacteria bacterium]